MHTLNLISYLLTVGYVIACAMYLSHMSASRESFGVWGTRALVASVLAHALFLIGFTWSHQRLPLAHLSEAMTVLAWFSASVYLLAEWRLRETTFGAFLLPIVFVLQLSASLGLQAHRPVNPILRDVLFETHAIANLLAYAAFALSFIASLMYILLYREVTQKQWGMFYVRFPSLEFLSAFSARAGLMGLVLLTAGIGLGTWNAVGVWQEGWSVDVKILTAFATWLIYGIFALFNWRRGWVGRRNAYLSIFGFVWVLFSFLIVTNYLSGVHSF